MTALSRLRQNPIPSLLARKSSVPESAVVDLRLRHGVDLPVSFRGSFGDSRFLTARAFFTAAILSSEPLVPAVFAFAFHVRLIVNDKPLSSQDIFDPEKFPVHNCVSQLPSATASVFDPEIRSSCSVAFATRCVEFVPVQLALDSVCVSARIAAAHQIRVRSPQSTRRMRMPETRPQFPLDCVKRRCHFPLPAIP